MATEVERRGELLAAVSNMVVQVYANSLGRGPTRARSFICEDVVLCLLEDTLTKAERTLQESGCDGRLLELRSILQETMHEVLAAGMERLTGRKVKALISGTELNPDIVSVVFILGASSEDAGPGFRAGAATSPSSGNGHVDAGVLREGPPRRRPRFMP